MGLRRVAIVGAGLTKFMRRAQETPKELAYEAAKLALDSCGLRLKDIDSVTIGTAPDAFDGVHRKGEFLADGSGGFGKPTMRHYVGGGTGCFSPTHGWFHVASGMFDTCLVVAEEKMSCAFPHPAGAFLTIFDHTTEQPLYPTLIWIFAMEMNRYMNTYGIPKELIAKVSVKNKGNALDHPAAQVAEKITVEDVLNSEVMAYPVNRLDISPVSDGAAAIVLAAEHVAERITDKPIWIDGMGWNLETSYWCTRDLAYPDYVEKAARMAYKMAGITEPHRQIDIAEPYDPFSYKELHHMEGLLLCGKGEAPQLLADGVTERTGRLPCCPSGGAMGVGNPIAATGLMKVIEIFLQLREEAGARQVPGKPRTGIAQAWGDLMQVGTVVVMRR